MPDEYFIWSNEHRAWWCANHRGYTTSLKAAGHYSRGEALKICSGACGGCAVDGIPPEVPVLAKDAWEALGGAEQAQ